VAGVVALALALRAPGCSDIAPVAVYVGLAFLAASTRVQIHPDVATMSLGFLFVFAALFLCGPSAAIAAAVLNVFGGLCFRPSGGWRQGLAWTLYSAGTLACAAWAAGTVHDALLPGGRTPDLDLSLIPATAAVTVYYLVTIVSVNLPPLVAGRGRPTAQWWSGLLWLAPVYYAGGAVALAIDVAYQKSGPAVFALCLPIGYVIHLLVKTRGDQLKGELRHLEERTRASEKMAQLYLSVVQALSTAIDVKDRGTHLHVRRVRALAKAVAERVGLEGAELEAVQTGAVLHDIGKLAVPDHVLRKPGRLTQKEFQLVQSHPAVGEAILRPIDFGVDIASIVRHHHEKVDGSGYPDGLSGEAIPLGARVLGVIDVYDALVSERPYRRAWSHEQALAHIRAQAGSAFDARVVEALVFVIEGAENAEPAHADPGPALPGLAVDTSRLEPPVGGSGAEQRLLGSRALTILYELAARFVDRAAGKACVVYVLDRRNGEVDAVGAAGPHAAVFANVRLPVAGGASGRAAEARAPSRGPSDEEFACLAMGCPEGLSGLTVTATPILGPSGRLHAVLSLYATLAGTDVQDALEEFAAWADDAGRQLDVLEAGPERAALLAHAAFLAALMRGAERARSVDETLSVVALSVEPWLEEREADWLWHAARELRVAGGGEGHVLVREEAGEILAAFPAGVEEAGHACVAQLRETAGVGPDALRVAVGWAVCPTDATDAHGLVSCALMQLERDRGAPTALPEAAGLVVPA
jgi:putative nucleotidyltransferase with HDIG domain